MWIRVRFDSFGCWWWSSGVGGGDGDVVFVVVVVVVTVRVLLVYGYIMNPVTYISPFVLLSGRGGEWLDKASAGHVFL